ncbi:MAG: purine-nucleoside phosphorylase [Candidatus Cloacimonetes bacterium]|nr:purine-nucleoside phosphorylase [Candidatus Cloacimonadota bacterium]
MTYLNRITQCSQQIKNLLGADFDTVEFGIICGSGLGSLADEIQSAKVIEYSQIQGFPVSSVAGHKSRLIAGYIHNKKVIAFQGRFHYYEGYSLEDVTLPIRVLKELGIHTLIVTNAAGGLNRNYSVGDLMLIDDHINFMFQNPLIGANHEALGARFPDMSQPYSQNAGDQISALALKLGIRMHRGVYLAVTGPSYETRSELRFFSTIADAVGMSTVPEVIAANHGNIPKIVGISVITNKATGEDIHKEDHNSVVAAAQAATPKMVQLVKEFIRL